MKLLIERDRLQSALAKVQGVVERKNTIPILQHVLIEARAGGELVLTATDLDIQARADADASVETPGATTAPVGRLYDIAKNLPPGGEISLAQDAGRLVVKCGRSRFQLPTLPASDFPAFAAGEAQARASLPAADLVRLIGKTSFAISTEATRYYMGGMRLHPVADGGKSRLRAVATDGTRLAYAEAACPAGWEAAEAITIPRKAVGEIARLLSGRSGDVAIWTNGRLFGVEVAGAALSTKLIDGSYPDYARVIPRDLAHTITADVVDFAAALKRCALMTFDRAKSVSLRLSSGQLAMRSRDGDGGEAEEILDLAFEGPDLDLKFNAGFLADVVAQMTGETVRFEVAGPRDAVKALDPADDAALFIVMPQFGA